MDDNRWNKKTGGTNQKGKGARDPQATRPIKRAQTPPADPWSQDAEDMATRPAVAAMSRTGRQSSQSLPPSDPWSENVEDMATRVMPAHFSPKQVPDDGQEALKTQLSIKTPPKGGPPVKASSASRSLYRSPDLDARVPSKPAISNFPTQTVSTADAMQTYVEAGEAAGQRLSRPEEGDALATFLSPSQSRGPTRPTVPTNYTDVDRTVASYDAPAEPTATSSVPPLDSGDPLATRLGADALYQEKATRQLKTPEPPPFEENLVPDAFAGRKNKATEMLPVQSPGGAVGGAEADSAYVADIRFLDNNASYDSKPTPRAGAPDVGTFMDDDDFSTDVGKPVEKSPSFNWGDDALPPLDAEAGASGGAQGVDSMAEHKKKQKAKSYWYGSYTAYDSPVVMNLAPGLTPEPLPVEKLGEWLRLSWEAFWARPTSFVIAHVVALFMVSISGGLLIGPALTGYLHYMGKVVRGDPEANPFDTLETFSRFGQSFILGFMIWITLGGVLFAAALLGFLLDMIPYLGFILQMALNLVATVVVATLLPIMSLALALMWNRDEGVPSKEFFRAVLRLVLQNPQAALMYGLFVGLLGASGSLAFGVGAFVTGPMAMWMMAMAYEAVFEADRERLDMDRNDHLEGV